MNEIAHCMRSFVCAVWNNDECMQLCARARAMNHHDKNDDEMLEKKNNHKTCEEQFVAKRQCMHGLRARAKTVQKKNNTCVFPAEHMRREHLIRVKSTYVHKYNKINSLQLLLLRFYLC